MIAGTLGQLAARSARRADCSCGPSGPTRGPHNTAEKTPARSGPHGPRSNSQRPAVPSSLREGPGRADETVGPLTASPAACLRRARRPACQA